jgi:hypothetical protein
MPSRNGRCRVPFGKRVAIVDRLLGGAVTREAVCAEWGIAEAELDEWLRMHARDRKMSLDEFRAPRAIEPAHKPLWSRLKQLESLLRARHRELLLLRQLARGRGLL